MSYNSSFALKIEHMQLEPGDKAPSFIINDIYGKTIDISQINSQKILLSFFRYAQCAVCQLRISEIMHLKGKLKEQDIEVIAVFQSTADRLKLNIVDKILFDFTIIADPHHTLYHLYSVKPSWLKTFKTLNINGMKRIFKSFKEGFKPGGKVEGHFHQIPADFLIDSNKTILLAKYGDNVVDHIPLSEIVDGA